ncbi:hypothetical protein FQY83_17375 [Luteimonas marina]|uniref:Uncharacterized protein n=1 Tax=Luteimonas marina TaxID=488485 RepID=A0A5C5TV88_9GAMM|nr:hypothetical protein [Luteimonas marina]TWT17110.1 hypothetical protein FQY83_17375 [Luteimonas marina]
MDGSVLLTPLQKLLEFFQKDRHHKDAQKDAALLAVSEAINATLKYEEESGGQKGFDRAQEYKLSQLWSDASVKVRHISRDLSRRLGEKTEYWADKLEWAPSELVERKIRLVEIRQAFRDLLRDA